MDLITLIDIGSTYTKLVALDKQKAQIVGQVKTPTTPRDISLGLSEGLAALEQQLVACEISSHKKLACSSAAGGLRMIAVGLVPDLTAEAAKRAALGAGARVLRTYAYQLTDDDLGEISQIKPDILLLAGGTDGGNQRIILENAEKIAALKLGIPVVVAGNRSAANKVSEILRQSSDPYITANVMPEIGKLQVDPARECIRQIFIDKIIYAKGFSKASSLIDGIFMPTPAAVLRAGQLISERDEELLIIDVGGATTDVHSLSHGTPTQSNVMLRGLPEPFAKRTVEGDLGLRVSAQALAEAVGVETIADFVGCTIVDVQNRLREIKAQPDTLGEGLAHKMDTAFGYFATKLAVKRHVGKITQTFTPSGPVWIQEGKDLTKIKRVICTGGIYVHHNGPLEMAKGALFTEDAPFDLKPKSPHIYLDAAYLLASVGLLAEQEPDLAYKVLKNNLELISGKSGRDREWPKK